MRGSRSNKNIMNQEYRFSKTQDYTTTAATSISIPKSTPYPSYKPSPEDTTNPSPDPGPQNKPQKQHKRPKRQKHQKSWQNNESRKSLYNKCKEELSHKTSTMNPLHSQHPQNPSKKSTNFSKALMEGTSDPSEIDSLNSFSQNFSENAPMRTPLRQFKHHLSQLEMKLSNQEFLQSQTQTASRAGRLKSDSQIDIELQECKATLVQLKDQLFEFNKVIEHNVRQKRFEWEREVLPRLELRARQKEHALQGYIGELEGEVSALKGEMNNLNNVLMKRDSEIGGLKERLDEYGDIVIEMKRKNFALVERLGAVKRSRKRNKVKFEQQSGEMFSRLYQMVQSKVQAEETRVLAMVKSIEFVRSQFALQNQQLENTRRECEKRRSQPNMESLMGKLTKYSDKISLLMKENFELKEENKALLGKVKSLSEGEDATATTAVSAESLKKVDEGKFLNIN